MCQSTMDLLIGSNIQFVHIPANCTDRLQPLNVSVNKSCKDYIKGKFVSWYLEEVFKALDDNDTDGDFGVDLRLSVMKPLGAKWMMSFFEYMKTRPSIVFNGFRSVGIASALNYSMDELETQPNHQPHP